MSSTNQRSEATTSEGSVKFGSVARCRPCTEAIPNSGIVPSQQEMPAARARSCAWRAGQTPPMRCTLMLRIRALPCRIHGADRLQIVSRFVEANGCVQSSLKLSMFGQGLPLQRLFNHHEVEAVQFLENACVVELVGRVCVHHEGNVAEAPAHGAHQVHIPPWRGNRCTGFKSSERSGMSPTVAPDASGRLWPPSKNHNGTPLCWA